MSEIRTDNITDASGVGAPDFPNGLKLEGVSLSTVIDNATNWKYTSTEQTITYGTMVTLVHGLGYTPTERNLSMICTTVQAPYAVGDVIDYPRTFSGGGTQYGADISADTTNLYIRIASGVTIITTNTGTALIITTANWKFVARAR